MLDDLKLIHERDPDDSLGVAEKQWQQLQHEYDIDLSRYSGVNNIVLGGMGGSGWPAIYVQTWGQPNVPFEIVRDYVLPAYVDDNTLFISSSYSGNTEETLSALDDA